MSDLSWQQILDFWYSEPISSHWFNSTTAIDDEIKRRYETTWQLARNGQLDHWKDSAEGCLALCILLDQFPLNMYRGQPAAFATEQQAVAITLLALENGFDQQLEPTRKVFLYMPLMHSENLAHQDRCVALFEASGLQDNARFARHHRALIQRFGRFPHRNAILGRESSSEELDYLSSKEAFKG